MVSKTTSKKPAPESKKGAVKPGGKRPILVADKVSKRKPGGPGKVSGN